jgi:transcriptional regulator with XRE-family HTH domain
MLVFCQNAISMTTLGDYIARLRDEKDWTMRELARKAGLSLGAVQKIENGTTQSPGIDVLLGLSQALNIPIMKLILAYQGRDPDRELKSATDEQVLQSIMEDALRIAIEKKRGEQS